MARSQFPPSGGSRPEWARPEYVVGAQGQISIPRGEPVGISFVLATSAAANVKVQTLAAFPNGFEFQVVAEYVVTDDLWDPMHGLAGLRGRTGDREGELPDEYLRLRVQFADGSEANNLGPPSREPIKPGPFLQYQSGNGAHGRAVGERSATEATFWLWPIPPAGPLSFACEWPKYGIPPTRHDIDTNPIRESAKRAADAWPDETAGGA